MFRLPITWALLAVSLLLVRVAQATETYEESAWFAVRTAQKYPAAEEMIFQIQHDETVPHVVSGPRKSFSYDVKVPTDPELLIELTAAFASPAGDHVERVPSRFPVLYRLLAQAFTPSASAEVREQAARLLDEISANPNAIQELYRVRKSLLRESPERVALEYLETKLSSNKLKASDDFFLHLSEFMNHGLQSPSNAELARLLDAWVTEINIANSIPGTGALTVADLGPLYSTFFYVDAFVRVADLASFSPELVAKLNAVSTNVKREYVRAIATRSLKSKSEKEGERVVDTLVDFSKNSDADLARDSVDLLASISHPKAVTEVSSIILDNTRPEHQLTAIAARTRIVRSLIENKAEALIVSYLREYNLGIFAQLAAPSSGEPEEIRRAAHDGLAVLTQTLVDALGSGHNFSRAAEKAMLNALAQTRTEEAVLALQRLAQYKYNSELALHAFYELLWLAQGHTDNDIIERLGTKALKCSIYLASPKKPE